MDRFRRNGSPKPDPAVVELEHICRLGHEILTAQATIATLLADIKDLLTRIDGRLDRLEARPSRETGAPHG